MSKKNDAKTTITYGGIEISELSNLKVERKASFDKDYNCQAIWTFDFVGVVDMGFPSDMLAANRDELQTRLSLPMRSLVYKVGDTVLLESPLPGCSMDADHGPIAKCCPIDLIGTNRFFVSMHIVTTVAVVVTGEWTKAHNFDMEIGECRDCKFYWRDYQDKLEGYDRGCPGRRICWTCGKNCDTWHVHVHESFGNGVGKRLVKPRLCHECFKSINDAKVKMVGQRELMEITLKENFDLAAKVIAMENLDNRNQSTIAALNEQNDRLTKHLNQIKAYTVADLERRARKLLDESLLGLRYESAEPTEQVVTVAPDLVTFRIGDWVKAIGSDVAMKINLVSIRPGWVRCSWIVNCVEEEKWFRADKLTKVIA